MPKRYGHLYDNVADQGNAEVAILNASKGKRDRNDVRAILDNKEHFAKELAALLREKRYVPTPSVHLIIKDGAHKKEREIVIPKFYPDQCIHWMLMQQIEHIIMRGMYRYSCGSIKNRGTKLALDTVQQALENDPKNCVWCMKLDVAKFYEHINHDRLKEMFRRVIKDPDVLWLIDTIIDGVKIGVPIGFYTSQWFANFYMQSIDHYIKEQLHIPHYVRYMDDMLLMSSNKRQLIRAKQSLDVELAKIGLTIRSNLENPSKKNWEIFKPRETGLEFIGYKFEAIRLSEHHHRYKWVCIMNRDTSLRVSRQMRKAKKEVDGKGLTLHTAFAVVSCYGIARRGNNWRYECKYMRPYVNFEMAKKVVSVETKKRRAAGLPLCNKHKRGRIVRYYRDGDSLPPTG